MSIATKRGDSGQTGLAGGIRVSKASIRVESYGTIDELNAALGIARALCPDPERKARTQRMQRELFRVGFGLATPPESRKAQLPVTAAMVDALTAQVHELEAHQGMLAECSPPGKEPVSVAHDLARTMCRRAERTAVRLMERGEAMDLNVSAALNRLSDLLWLYARRVELASGAVSSLREMNGASGPRWSGAW